jgi:hypothetical protein
MHGEGRAVVSRKKLLVKASTVPREERRPGPAGGTPYGTADDFRLGD